jgi:hypothetical protein
VNGGERERVRKRLEYHQTWGKLKVSGEGEKNNDDNNTIYLLLLAI